jgi:hypothetical protein
MYCCMVINDMLQTHVVIMMNMVKTEFEKYRLIFVLLCQSDLTHETGMAGKTRQRVILATSVSTIATIFELTHITFIEKPT